MSVILPTFNEGRIAEKAVSLTADALQSAGIDYEVIVIDDGSSDDTVEIVESLISKNPRIRLLKNYVNLNQGASILRGFFASEKDFVIHNGIDLPLAPTTVLKLLDLMSDADVLAIQRTEYSGASLWRRFVSQINQNLRKVLFPKISKQIPDMNYTQMIRRSVLTSIKPLARSPAFTTPELIIRAHRRGLRIKKTFEPIQPRERGSGAFGRPHDMMWSLYDMLRFRILLWRGQIT